MIESVPILPTLRGSVRIQEYEENFENDSVFQRGLYLADTLPVKTLLRARKKSTHECGKNNAKQNGTTCILVERFSLRLMVVLPYQ